MSRPSTPESVSGHAVLVEVVKTAHSRGWYMACRPSDRAQAEAALEEVYEDPQWPRPEQPRLILHPDVPSGRIGFFDPNTQRLTGLLEHVTGSKRGLSRLAKLWFPNHRETPR